MQFLRSNIKRSKLPICKPLTQMPVEHLSVFLGEDITFLGQVFGEEYVGDVRNDIDVICQNSSSVLRIV